MNENEKVTSSINKANRLGRDMTDAVVEELLSPENLSKRTTRTFQGFEIVDSLDGRPDASVEVSLVRIIAEGQYPQHVHKKSDAYFIVTAGEAVFLSGAERTMMRQGDRVDIPRGTPHGFEIAAGTTLEFISIQSPPIKDEHSGEEDFHLIDHI